MRELEIVFTKSKKCFPIGSWLIQWYTKQPYSHVAKGHEVRDWGKAYYQASEGKVNYEYHTEFYKKHEVVKKYVLLIPTEVRTEINKACFQDAGKKYGMLQNIGIVFTDIAKKLGFNVDNPFKSGRNCSELLYLKVFKVLKPELDYDPEKIKPHEIEAIILKYFKDDILDI